MGVFLVMRRHANINNCLKHCCDKFLKQLILQQLWGEKISILIPLMIQSMWSRCNCHLFYWGIKVFLSKSKNSDHLIRQQYVDTTVLKFNDVWKLYSDFRQYYEPPFCIHAKVCTVSKPDLKSVPTETLIAFGSIQDRCGSFLDFACFSWITNSIIIHYDLPEKRIQTSLKVGLHFVVAEQCHC